MTDIDKHTSLLILIAKSLIVQSGKLQENFFGTKAHFSKIELRQAAYLQTSYDDLTIIYLPRAFQDYIS